MGTPHKHAEAIKAWADGAEIECRRVGMGNHTWADCGKPGNDDGQPGWFDEFEYRIKPANVLRFCPVFLLPAGSIVVGEGKVCRASAIDVYEGGKLPHERLAGIIRLELDPTTFDLVSATMEKA